jgi:hypothetical protein
MFKIQKVIWKIKKIIFKFKDEYFDCGTDLLQTFSKYLNLRSIFTEPNLEDRGRLGIKVEDKWFNGSMGLMFGNIIEVNSYES